MRLVAGGEIGLVGVLFERHHAGLYRFFRRLSGAPAAAEDLVQETFLRLLKYRRSFRPGGSFRAWLFAVARSAARDELARRDRQRPTPTETEEPKDESPLPSDRAEAAEKLDRLEQALRRLSPEDREALLLARFENLSHAELASALGCSIGAARVRVHRALTRLRDHYQGLTEVTRAVR